MGYWGCKNIAVRIAMQMPIGQKQPNFKIPYFPHPNAAPCTVLPGCMPPFAIALPTATGCDRD